MERGAQSPSLGVTTEEFAAILGCSRETVLRRRKLEDGRFPQPTKRHGKTYVWADHAVDEYLVSMGLKERTRRRRA